jgi:excisionase family DNA binding protein
VADSSERIGFLTASEAASILRLGRSTIYELAHRREIPGATFVGKRLLINRAYFTPWIQALGDPSRSRQQHGLPGRYQPPDV